MSWDEVKKAVNSDLSVPLNHLIWLQDYKTYGENSYVFQNKDILHELYNSVSISATDKAITIEAFNAIIENDYPTIGAFFGAMTDIKQSGANVDWKSLKSMNDIVANETAMNAIAESKTAMSVIAANVIAMSVVASSETAISAIASSETAMKAITTSPLMTTKSISSSDAESYTIENTFVTSVNAKAYNWYNPSTNMNYYSIPGIEYVLHGSTESTILSTSIANTTTKLSDVEKTINNFVKSLVVTTVPEMTGAIATVSYIPSSNNVV